MGWFKNTWNKVKGGLDRLGDTGVGKAFRKARDTAIVMTGTQKISDALTMGANLVDNALNPSMGLKFPSLKLPKRFEHLKGSVTVPKSTSSSLRTSNNVSSKQGDEVKKVASIGIGAFILSKLL
ncbi:hypothetical protein MY04_1120 [Flammeovirga sp. MY04]|uniref:hypothetical protein n=1 Tax=Flammeovirga sp. MY04 TaxID=1191459 RepID=UPI0008063BEC|nr:hypothetical protein [Flammeovirga sp. MY04]ANQ48497.1 hypothetical protein MY04_1120 [Flammeovirga sp. MY04]